MNYPEGSIVAVAERLRRDSPHAADALDMYQRRILGAFEYMAQMCIAAGVAADVVGPSAVLLLVWEAKPMPAKCQDRQRTKFSAFRRGRFRPKSSAG